MDNVGAYLDNPRTCALYLNDAMESGDVGTIIEALRDIARRKGSRVRSLGAGETVHLAEMMEILRDAGVRLVAEPRK